MQNALDCMPLFIIIEYFTLLTLLKLRLVVIDLHIMFSEKYFSLPH